LLLKQFIAIAAPMVCPRPLLICALLLAGCAADPGAGLDLESRSIAVEQNAVPTSGAGAAGSVQHLLPSTGPTYVTLTIARPDPSGGIAKVDQAITSGSGYVVDPSGIILTAAHVGVSKGNSVSARAANGRVYSGKVVAILPANDIAVIKLIGFSGKAVVPAAPGCIAKGDLVYTLGKPHAQGDLARVGAFESRHFGRAVAYGKFGYPDALVLRMGTQKGESGGPLFDGNGRLIGMVVSTLADANGNSINLAHAIPSTALANFYCANAACSQSWTTLASKSVDECGGA
jgi:S1-C subfamily serine protease